MWFLWLGQNQANPIDNRFTKNVTEQDIGLDTNFQFFLPRNGQQIVMGNYMLCPDANSVDHMEHIYLNDTFSENNKYLWMEKYTYLNT